MPWGNLNLIRKKNPWYGEKPNINGNMKKGKAIKDKVKKREEENIINGKFNKEKKIRDKGRKCIVRKCSHS